MNIYNFFTTISLFTLLSIFQQVNSGKVYYKATLKKPVESGKQQNQSVDELIHDSEDIYYVLEFDKKESVYKKASNSMVNSSSKPNITEALTGGSALYYTANNMLQKPFFKKEKNGVTFLISYDTTSWELTEESKIIHGYLCYKAVNVNREKGIQSESMVAWYAPEIPFSYGPKNFHGLPGLILEITTSSFSLCTEKIVLNPDQINIQKPKKGTRLTKEEYYSKMMSSFKN